MTAEMVAYLIRYGLKQSIDDAGADPKKGAAGSKARLEAIVSGEVPEGGGARLSPMERALRTVVERRLRKAGYKAAQAAKAAKEPEKAFRDLIRAVIGAKTQTPAAKVPDDVVTKNVERNWPAVIAEARTIAEAEAGIGAGLDVEV